MNETMTVFELSYLIGETEAFIDVVFNRWVQATFAVLVATYFAGTKINMYFLKLMGGLYIAYTLAQAATLAFQISKLNEYIEHLETITEDYAGNAALAVPSGALIILVFVIGTASTLYFIRHTMKSGEVSAAP